jgi:septal ring factor EnvC (AmiA/AmiB activator)
MRSRLRRRARGGGPVGTPIGMSMMMGVVLLCIPSVMLAQQPATPPPTAPAPAPEVRLRADRDALDQIRAERAALEQRMAELRGTVHDLSDEVENLDRQVDVTARALRTLDGQLVAIGTEVDSATAGLVRAQDELAIKRAMLRHRLVDIYKRGPLYSTQALLTADSFGALIARYKYLHLLALRDRALVTRVDQLQNQIGRQRMVLVSLEQAVSFNRQEKANEEKRLQSLADERSHSLVQAKHTQATTQARLKQIASAEAHLESVISTLEEARRRAESRANAPAPSASTLTTRDLGQLDWPVDGTILYRFGRVINPNNTTTRWNGIGIGAPMGTAVRAVAAGVVVVARSIGTYGQTVIVQHGGGDYSVYGSLSRMDVKEGAHVERGQNIGAVGRTDPDLPAHLHFEIRRDQGHAVDPLDWLRGGAAR